MLYYVVSSSVPSSCSHCGVVDKISEPEATYVFLELFEPLSLI